MAATTIQFSSPVVSLVGGGHWSGWTSALRDRLSAAFERLAEGDVRPAPILPDDLAVSLASPGEAAAPLSEVVARGLATLALGHPQVRAPLVRAIFRRLIRRGGDRTPGVVHATTDFGAPGAAAVALFASRMDTPGREPAWSRLFMAAKIPGAWDAIAIAVLGDATLLGWKDPPPGSRALLEAARSARSWWNGRLDVSPTGAPLLKELLSMRALRGVRRAAAREAGFATGAANSSASLPPGLAAVPGGTPTGMVAMVAEWVAAFQRAAPLASRGPASLPAYAVAAGAIADAAEPSPTRDWLLGLLKPAGPSAGRSPTTPSRPRRRVE